MPNAERYISIDHSGQTEGDILQRLRNGAVYLPPLQLKLIATEGTPHNNMDGVLEAVWQGRSSHFALECKASSTPKVIEIAAAQARRHATLSGLLPLVLVPFLSEEHLRGLEQQSVSGIDLCGNGIVIGHDFFVWRSGQPNRFKSSQSIKNIYRGSSSIFARCFLLRPEFDSLAELRSFALYRLLPSPGQTAVRLVASTASKVVQALEQELIVIKEDRRLRLGDSRRLLARLRENFTRGAGCRLDGKTTLSAPEVWQRLQEAKKQGLNYAATGLGSASRYGILSGGETLSLYVNDLKTAAGLLEVKESRIFPNIQLTEDRGSIVYFDLRREGAILWASPIQTWLELSAEGPREREAAQLLARELEGGGAEKLL